MGIESPSPTQGPIPAHTPLHHNKSSAPQDLGLKNALPNAYTYLNHLRPQGCGLWAPLRCRRRTRFGFSGCGAASSTSSSEASSIAEMWKSFARPHDSLFQRLFQSTPGAMRLHLPPTPPATPDPPLPHRLLLSRHRCKSPAHPGQAPPPQAPPRADSSETPEQT